MMLFDLSSVLSRVRVRGANRLDFLHRMSTGDLLNLRPGQGRATVFTTPIGRMVDLAIVLAGEDSLLLLSGAGQGKLVRWLRKYIFFNDDVQLADESATLPTLGLYGEGEWPQGVIALDVQAASAWPLYAHATVDQGVFVKAPPLEGSGFYLLGAKEVAAERLSSLSRYHDLRIRAGYPAAPNEINENYIPLEAGLGSAISFTKGCYIGQEIIARMESRKQLAKRLVLLEAERGLRDGDGLFVEGAQAGSVTSATSDGRAALAYVRSSLAQPGQSLQTGEGPEQVAAKVAGLAGM